MAKQNWICSESAHKEVLDMIDKQAGKLSYYIKAFVGIIMLTTGMVMGGYIHSYNTADRVSEKINLVDKRTCIEQAEMRKDIGYIKNKIVLFIPEQRKFNQKLLDKIGDIDRERK